MLAASAGVPWSNFYFRLLPGAIRRPQIIEFLSHLLRHIRGKLLIVWDGLPGHRSDGGRSRSENRRADLHRRSCWLSSPRVFRFLVRERHTIPPDSLCCATGLARQPTTGSELSLMLFHNMSSSETTGNSSAALTQYFTENSGLQLGIKVSAFPSSSHSASGEVCVFEA